MVVKGQIDLGELGTSPLTKATLKITDIYPKMSICTSAETNMNRHMSMDDIFYPKRLNVNPSDIIDDLTIHLGDEVILKK